MTQAVFCIAKSLRQASEIVSTLRVAGFAADDVSVLLADAESPLASAANTRAPEGAVAGAGAGGIVGGVAAWFAGIGSLAIPGVGPFVAAGPILAALGGAAVGAGVGGIGGALVGYGMPEYEAKRYEGRVSEGGILISVHADDPAQCKRATYIFESAGAESISSAAEASAEYRPRKAAGCS